MKCSNCGQEIADNSTICGFCGKTVTTAAQTPEIQTSEETKVPGDTAPISAGEIPEAALMPEVSGIPEEIVPPVKKKRGALKFVLIAILVLLAALTAVVIAKRDVLVNMFHRTFDSPEKYFRYIQNREIEREADNIADAYESFILNGFSSSKGVDLTIGFELDDAGRELLSLATEGQEELEWLENLQVHTLYSLSDEGSAVEGDIGLNDEQLISFVSLANIEDMMNAVQIPEIMEEYVGFPVEDDDQADRNAEAMEKLQELLAALPEKKEVRNLIARYGKILGECINDVDMDSDSLAVGGVSQNCTVLEYEVDYEVVLDAVERIRDMIEEDEELETVLRRLCEIEGIVGKSYDDDTGDFEYPDSDDAYDVMMEQLLNGLDDILEQADETREEIRKGKNAVIECSLYVASDGEVIGRRTATKGFSKDDLVIEYAALHSGGKAGYEFSVTSGMFNVLLSGSGKERSGKLTGEFELEVMGTEYLEIGVTDLDMKGLGKGEYHGSLHLEPGTGLNRLLGHSSVTSSFTESSLDILLDVGSGKQQFEISANDREDRLFKLSMIMKNEKLRKPEIPDDIIEDEDELEEIFEDEDLKDELLERFEDAGVPEMFLRSMRNDDDMIGDLYRMISSAAELSFQMNSSWRY